MASKDNYIRVEGLDELIHRLFTLSNESINEELLNEIGTFLSASIPRRVARGKDVSGKTFEPYSPKYRLFRKKHGHPVNKVNLYFHGTMLSSLTYSVYDDRVEVFFMNTYGKTPSGKPSKISSAEKAYFLNQKRNFFGITDYQQSQIRKMIHAHLNRLIED